MIIFFLLLSIISLLEINFFFLFIYRQLYHLFVANLLNEIDLRVFLFFSLSFSFELHQLNFRFETETIHLFLTGAFDWQNVSTRKLTSIIIEILERADESIREDVLQNTRKNFFFYSNFCFLFFFSFFFIRWSKLENFSPSKRVALLERNENSTGESARGAFYLLKYSPGENKIKIEIDA